MGKLTKGKRGGCYRITIEGLHDVLFPTHFVFLACMQILPFGHFWIRGAIRCQKLGIDHS